MADRLTEKAQKALRLGAEIASSLGHIYLGSEHLLWGLAGVPDSVAGQVLQAGGITPQAIEGCILRTHGRGAETTSTPEPTPRSKRILQLAGELAIRLNHSYIGTEHILMAIIAEGENDGVHYLILLGASPQELYAQCLRAVGNGDSDVAFSGSEVHGKKKGRREIEKYTVNLTEAAKKGRLDPVIGRQKEIERVMEILSRRTKNNPVLIGEPGVGKTAIAEGLASAISENTVPETLRGKQLLSLNLSNLVAGTKYRGDFEERIKNLLEEIKTDGQIILFIDELHTLIGAGASEGAVDAANILKPALARGEIRVIGATTTTEYRKYIEKDAALERRFQPVTVEQPSEEDAIAILFGLRDRYEAHHKVQITDDAIKAAVQLSARYISDRFLPDKAVDLMDEACSKVRLQLFTAPPELKELETSLQTIKKEKEAAVTSQNFERAAKLRDEEKQLQLKLKEKKQQWNDQSHHPAGQVTEQEIAQIVSRWTGVPVTRLTHAEGARLMQLKEELQQRVMGQEEAIDQIVRAIKRGRLGISDPVRPIGSFLFLGPTGVGKTELCKALAESLFGSEDAMIRLDMSELMEKHAVAKLIGAPPGYVGYEEGGQLTDRVRTKPYSVVLFDEIEKAHPDVFHLLLQILEEGHLTDAQGRRVSFRQCVVILTGNIGADQLAQKQITMGFGGDHGQKAAKDRVMAEAKKTFRPELINRLDGVIIFDRLGVEQLAQIAEKLLNRLRDRLKKQNINLAWNESVVQKLASTSMDEAYGARPLRRNITTWIEDPLSDLLLKGDLKNDASVHLDWSGDHLQIV